MDEADEEKFHRRFLDKSDNVVAPEAPLNHNSSVPLLPDSRPRHAIEHSDRNAEGARFCLSGGKMPAFGLAAGDIDTILSGQPQSKYFTLAPQVGCAQGQRRATSDK